jgi:hypothetical protein
MDFNQKTPSPAVIGESGIMLKLMILFLFILLAIGVMSLLTTGDLTYYYYMVGDFAIN